ncbi:MAG: YeeE/YedE family protein [Rhizobiales bacterium]|nr:YeeE/YedE family protein [Hyphomicrobiales bacterium]
MTTEFTPYASLAGGLLIGLAAVLLMLSNGRIMGATGILSGIIMPSSVAELSWKSILLMGMVSAPILLSLVFGYPAIVQVVSSTPMLVLGGLLVGIGGTLGGGCTSGHGVCGMARLSSRSIVATITFMISTTIAVYVLRHIIGL